MVITARSDDKGAATVAGMLDRVPGADVSYEVLELGSLDSVRAFTDRFTATHDRLDVLIGNAGIMAVPFGRTDDGFELQFGTNHLGHFDLVGRLLPLLVASAPSRIVLLSSGGHMASDIHWDDPNFESHEYNKMDAYGQSKTANILHAVELERRYGPLGVHAYAVHPGMVATQLGRNFTPDVMEDLAARAASAPSGSGKLPPVVGTDVGAATSVWAATAPELDAAGRHLPRRLRGRHGGALRHGPRRRGAAVGPQRGARRRDLPRPRRPLGLSTSNCTHVAHLVVTLLVTY